MFDGSAFSWEKLSFSEIDGGSKIFKKLIESQGFSPDTALAGLMAHFKKNQ